MRAWSLRLFLVGLALTAVSAVIVVGGFRAAAGAGHGGNAALLIVGLALGAISWLTMLGSCITAVMSRRGSDSFPWWLVPAAAMTVSTGLLGLSTVFG